MNKKVRKETEIVHGVHNHHATSLDLVPPIHMTSTFKFKDSDHGAALFSGEEEGYIYTRLGNPTIDLLQEKIAVIEHGEAALAVASGLAAVSSVVIGLAKPGDNFVTCNAIYGGTYSLFNKHMNDMKIPPKFITPEQAGNPESIEKYIDENTKFLYMETPANPTLDVFDIEMWANVAKKHSLPLVVDNTFASPYLSNPLDLGADVVVHSGTKYISGHGDLIGGFIVSSKEIIKKIYDEYTKNWGPSISPFNAWLFMRGIKTLAIRMEKHCRNAQKVAEYLEKHQKVEKVYYPGLKSSPYHELAKKQMTGFGGMIAFDLKGGFDAGKTVMDNVNLCVLAVSLGDCETLICHPASTTHASYSTDDRLKAGISDGLVRISIGIEDADDIIDDLSAALELI